MINMIYKEGLLPISLPYVSVSARVGPVACQA